MPNDGPNDDIPNVRPIDGLKPIRFKFHLEPLVDRKVVETTTRDVQILVIDGTPKLAWLEEVEVVTCP